MRKIELLPRRGGRPPAKVWNSKDGGSVTGRITSSTQGQREACEPGPISGFARVRCSLVRQICCTLGARLIVVCHAVATWLIETYLAEWNIFLRYLNWEEIDRAGLGPSKEGSYATAAWIIAFSGETRDCRGHLLKVLQAFCGRISRF